MDYSCVAILCNLHSQNRRWRGESSEPVQLVPVTNQGLSKTEEELKKAVRSNSHAILARATEIPISEIDIPLCRMIVMTDVRQSLEIDIQKLRSEFTMGYKRGGPIFYVAMRNFSMEEAVVMEAMRKGWSKLWRKVDKEFESIPNNSPYLKKFSNWMFYVWHGNHRLLAWYPFIATNQRNNPTFLVPLKSIVLKVKENNRKELLHAMTDWNKF